MREEEAIMLFLRPSRRQLFAAGFVTPLAVGYLVLSAPTTIPDPSAEACKAWYVDLAASGAQEIGRCSAVAVGEHVAMTAGHCVAPQTKKIVLETGLAARSGTCEPFPNADLALCVFDDSFSSEETKSISTDPARLVPQSQVILSGFGCLTGACEGTPEYGFTAPGAGWATIVSSTAQSPVTFVTAGKAGKPGTFLCSGDSGGPVCDENGSFLLGVGRASCADGASEWQSAITSLAADEVVRWMCEWKDGGPNRHIKGLTCPA
jgi:hypothetical protein